MKYRTHFLAVTIAATLLATVDFASSAERPTVKKRPKPSSRIEWPVPVNKAPDYICTRDWSWFDVPGQEALPFPLEEEHQTYVAEAAHSGESSESFGARKAEESRRKLGSEHPKTLRWLLYQNDWSFDLSHRYPIGLRLYRACVRQYGRYHQETLYWLDNLAEAARSIERMSEATKACRSAYDDSVRVLGREHPQTVKRLKSLIESLMDSRDYHEAERLCRQRIRIVGTQVPSDSEAMWRERQKLAEICVHTNKSAESEAIFRSILVAQEREFGPISIETGEACNNLGVALARKGEFAEAETLFLRAFESFEAGMTMKFMQTPRYLPSFPYDFGKQPIFAHNLGVLYYTKKDYAAALSFAEDGESAYVGFVFPAHQYQKDYLNYLAFLRVKVGLPPNYPHQPQPRKR